MKNVGIVFSVLLALLAGVVGGRMSVRPVEATERPQGGVAWQQTDKGIELTGLESDTAIAYLAMRTTGNDWPGTKLDGAHVFSPGTSVGLPGGNHLIAMITSLGITCSDECVPCTDDPSAVPPVSTGVMGIPIGPPPCRAGIDCPCPPPPTGYKGRIGPWSEMVGDPTPDDPHIDPTPN